MGELLSIDTPVDTPTEAPPPAPEDGERPWAEAGFAPWVEPAYRWATTKWQPANRWAERWLPAGPLVAMIALYLVHFGGAAVQTFRGYGVAAYDFGIFDQGVWLLSRFHDPFVTVMGRNLFGDHSSYILLLVSPLYWVYPHAAALLVLQTVAVALGTVPIYLIARHFGLHFVAANLLAAAYLLDPAVEHATLEGFHPECFLPLLLGMALYAAINWKPRVLVAMAILALLVKEDVGLLLLVPLGIWIALRRDGRLGAAITAGGAMWSAVMTLAVMPAVLGYFTPSDQGRMPFGGFSGFLRTLAPTKMATYLTAESRPFYLWQMLFATGFGFMLGPEIAAISLFVLAENYLSPDPYEHQILYHYSLAPSAVLLVGVAFAVARQRRRILRALVPATTVLCSFIACVLWGSLPMSSHPPILPQVDTAQNRTNAALVAMIPPDAVVSADTYFVAHLDHRTQVYLWPTPFRTGNYGKPSDDGKRLPAASNVRYLLLSLPQSPESTATLLSISTEFHLVKRVGSAALFARDGPSAP